MTGVPYSETRMTVRKDACSEYRGHEGIVLDHVLRRGQRYARDFFLLRFANGFQGWFDNTEVEEDS